MIRPFLARNRAAASLCLQSGLSWTSRLVSSSSASGGSQAGAGDGGDHGKGSDTSGARPASGAAFAKETDKGEATRHDVVSDPASVYAHSRLSAKDTESPFVATSRVPLTAGSVRKGEQEKSAGDQQSSSPAWARGPFYVRAPKSSSAGATGSQSTPGAASSPAGAGGALEKKDGASDPSAVATRAKPQDGPIVPDYGPLRATGLWSVDEVVDEQKRTVDFRRIDDVESDIVEEMKTPDEALVPYEEEEKWKHKLMFVHKFKKTPKHLTWKELGEEIECMDCFLELDEHRPEELFTIKFFFTDKKTGTRDLVWEAKNDVSYSEGFTDLLAAVGACLGRSDVHRTIRFDDGQGQLHDFTIRKRSRYTSDITLSFRPAEKYNKFQRKEELDEFESAMEAEGMSTWGYHPSLMDPEYSELDLHDPEGTYVVAMSAHGFCFIFLKAVNRLLARPMKEFYRPSQLMRTAKVRTEDDIGLAHAMKGWMGIDEQIYPHYTPIEALQDHWLGKDAPFSLVAIVNKLREMCYLKKQNPEFQSWLSVRNNDTHTAIRNLGVKLLGVGASTLFLPVQHNSTVNRLLPKHQQRRLESRFSLNALMGLPDETRRLGEFKQITGHARIGEADAAASTEKGKGTKSEPSKH